MKVNRGLALSFELAVEIIALCNLLYEKKQYVVARQLLRAGTSVGANLEESVGAESRADFIHKLHVAYKEARETRYWIKLLIKSNCISEQEAKGYFLADELVRILAKSLTSLQKSK